MEKTREIKDRLVRIPQAPPGAYRQSVLGLTLLTLLGVTALTQAMAAPTPTPAESATAPVPSSGAANTQTYRADTPNGVWDGWGFASPPNPNAAKEPAPTPEAFEIVEQADNAPRIFSGKVAGLESMQGVEVGLVSLVGVHWVNPKTYQWEPVAADGSFSLTDARYLDANKAVVMRGPNTAWTFLRYNFSPNQSAKNILLNAAPSKKVRLTASGPEMENLTKLGIEPFFAHTQFNDKGGALRRQRLGGYNSKDENYLEVLLPVGEVSLFVNSPGWAGFYQTIDTRRADHFHFVLKPAGQLKVTALDQDGNPKKGVRADWVNPAAPLSISNGTTKQDGSFLSGSLVPGTFQVTIESFGSLKIEIQERCVTKVLLQEGKEPVISRSEWQPTRPAQTPPAASASPAS